MYFRAMEASSESRTEQRLLDASLLLLVAYNVLFVADILLDSLPDNAAARAMDFIDARRGWITLFEAIAAAAEHEGAIAIRRPAAIAGDTASSESALLHALDMLEKQGPLEAELVFLQCTSPFTTGVQIDAVLAALKDEDCNSSFSVSPWHGFLWRVDGRGINHNPELPRQRRQDLEPAFLETGAIYAMATAAFRQSGSRFCAPWQPVVIDDSGPEIDTPADLALCRSLAALTAG